MPSSDNARQGSSQNPLEALARFAAIDLRPERKSVMDATARAVIDFVGMGIAGTVSKEATPIRNYARSTWQPGESTALGLSGHFGPECAAFINGATAHILDWDDCLEPFGGHPTAVVLPVLLALSESGSFSTRDIFEGYIAAVEAAAALGRCLNWTHYERGWHPTATLGIFGATIAAARLLKLNVETTTRALAIAASLASGIKGNFGTAMKSVQVGLAASKGIMAAKLAAAGVSANEGIFQGAHSFPSVFDGTPIVDWSPLQRIGEDWALLSPGLIFKLYPCCGSTHASIDAILSLRSQFNIDWKRTREIEIGVHPRRLPHVNRPRPKTGLEGKFSLQYTGAVALVDGEVRPDHFLKEAFDDQRVQSLLERVVVKELPPAEQTIVEGRDDCYAATVRIFTDETEYLLHVDAPSGSIPEFPVSDSELERKFRSAVSPVIGRDNVDQLWGQMDDWLIGKTGTQAFLNHVNRLVLKGD